VKDGGTGALREEYAAIAARLEQAQSPVEREEVKREIIGYFKRTPPPA